MTRLLLILAIVLVNVPPPADGAEEVQVRLDPAVVRDIGGVTRFDRNQFITIHESPGSKDMSDRDKKYLRRELDVRYGRDGGSLSWNASRTPADAM